MRATIGRLLLIAVITAFQIESIVDDGRAQGRIGASQTVVERQGVTRCLLNAVRRRHHMPALRASSALQEAAIRHSRDMVSTGAFSHDIPGTPNLAARAGAAGYLRRGMGWRLGEVIGWGPADVATPRVMARAWLRSSVHRSILLDRTFRDVGVGVASTSGPGDPTVAYTIDFGSRLLARRARAGHSPRHAGAGCDAPGPRAARAATQIDHRIEDEVRIGP